MSNGGNLHPLEDGRLELSLRPFIPWDCVLQVRVAGLQVRAADFAILVDDVVLPVRIVGETALAQVPKPQGYHMVAVRWTPPPDIEPALRVTAHRFKSMRQLQEEHPELIKVVMKYQKRERFLMSELVVLSYPDGGKSQVYGIFTVDKDVLRNDPDHGPIVKQDFLVWRPGGDEPRIVYYSGQGDRKGDGAHQHIERLCERFGAPHFGCERTDRGWTCRDHWYRADELDERLPVKPEFRAAIETALRKARAEIGA